MGPFCISNDTASVDALAAISSIDTMCRQLEREERLAALKSLKKEMNKRKAAWISMADDDDDDDDERASSDHAQRKKAHVEYRAASDEYSRAILLLASLNAPELRLNKHLASVAGVDNVFDPVRALDHYDNRVRVRASKTVFFAEYEGEPCALKRFELHDDATLRAFRREVAALVRLQHPNVVKINCAFVEQSNEFGWLHMPKSAPGDLWQWKATLKNNAADDVYRRVFRDALCGLAHVHSNGFVHGDVKPGNVLVDGATETAKLADFDASRCVDAAAHAAGATTTVVVKATPRYLAPERRTGGGKATKASDVFSFALTCVDVRTAASATTLAAVTDDGAAALVAASAALSDVAKRTLQAMLASDAAQRPDALTLLTTATAAAASYFATSIDARRRARRCAVTSCGASSVDGVACDVAGGGHWICADCVRARAQQVVALEESAEDAMSAPVTDDGTLRCPVKPVAGRLADCAGVFGAIGASLAAQLSATRAAHQVKQATHVPCAICLCLTEVTHFLVPCGHAAFHEACMTKTLQSQRNNRCPTCRKPVTKMEKMFK